MKRINVLVYYDLAAALEKLRAVILADKIFGHTLYFSFNEARDSLSRFISSSGGFSAAERAAFDLESSLRSFVFENFYTKDSPSTPSFEKFGEEFQSWQFHSIKDKITRFGHVFSEECSDTEIYSVDSVGIYRTRTLANEASLRLKHEKFAKIPAACLSEYDSAGRCLAFELPTACGFHALRAVEIMMAVYFSKFLPKAKKPQNWGEYIRGLKDLDAKGGKGLNLGKIVSLLDRIREVDRNPLMHPDDTLDSVDAETLFSLSAIVIAEIARELSVPDARPESSGEVEETAVESTSEASHKVPH